MNMSPEDYRSMVFLRIEKLRGLLYNQYGAPAQANHPGAAVNNEAVPDFDAFSALVSEIDEIMNEYKFSVGPA